MSTTTNQNENSAQEPALLSAESSTVEIAATQKEVAPLLFDLEMIEKFHPFLETAEIIGEQRYGVGAVRQLTYKKDFAGGASFKETVIESKSGRIGNGIDLVRFELSELNKDFFPCEELFAQIQSQNVDQAVTTTTSFTVKFEYTLMAGVDGETAARFIGSLGYLARTIPVKAKELVENRTVTMEEAEEEEFVENLAGAMKEDVEEDLLLPPSRHHHPGIENAISGFQQLMLIIVSAAEAAASKYMSSSSSNNNNSNNRLLRHLFLAPVFVLLVLMPPTMSGLHTVDSSIQVYHEHF